MRLGRTESLPVHGNEEKKESLSLGPPSLLSNGTEVKRPEREAKLLSPRILVTLVWCSTAGTTSVYIQHKKQPWNTSNGRDCKPQRPHSDCRPPRTSEEGKPGWRVGVTSRRYRTYVRNNWL
jgi:hypothetical protein